jgi:L-alanine-DL-glutamate epimerase-like enolase superfamily enzyme
MLITSAQLYPLEVPMDKPIKMAGETLTHAQTVLLRLTDQHGRTGWGEASSAPLMTGETLASLFASTAYLTEKLVGARIDNPADLAALHDRILYGNPSAKSCHATAVLDLLAQDEGVPMYRFLQGHMPGASSLPPPAVDLRPRRLEMLHMLASGDLEGELAEAQALRRQGYRHWKIKVGTGDVANDVARDVRRVRALCAALGGDVVSADANQGLSLSAASAIARAGRDNGLAFLEQPFRVGMMTEMAALHRDTGLALCADESIQDADDIAAHGEARAAQGVSLKLIKLGGPARMLEAGRLALARGLRVNLACKVAETTISAAATAHAGFALDEVAWGFSMSNRYLAGDVCAQPLAPVDGAVDTSQLERPGLGFAPEADRLRDFASATVAGQSFRV